MPFLNALFLIVLLFSGSIVQADSQLKLQPLQTLVKESFASLIPDPNNPDVLYGITPLEFVKIPNRADALRNVGGGHLYKSSDKGLHWEILDFNRRFLGMVVDPINSDVLYAIHETSDQYYDVMGLNVLKSINGGKTWVLLLTSKGNDKFSPANTTATGYTRYMRYAEIFISSASQNIFYVFLNNQLYRTDDAGSIWKKLTLPSSEYLSIAIHPSDPQILLSASQEGQLFISNDAGVTWQTITHNLKFENYYLSNQYITGSPSKLWISPNPFNVLYLDVITRSGWQFGETPSSLSIIDTYKSSDGGQTWQIIPKPQIDCTTNCYNGLFYVDPHHKGVLYSYASYASVQSEGYRRSILYRSQDDGNTWNEVFRGGEGILWTMLSHPKKLDTFYVSSIGQINETQLEGNLQLTENTGKTWTILDNGVKKSISLSFPILNPNNPKNFYALGENAVIYQTEDGGHKFTALPPFITGLSNYTTHNTDRIIAVTENAAIGFKYRWMNKNWQLYQNQSDSLYGTAVTGSDIYHVLKDSTGKDSRGSDFQAIYLRSRDGGNTWQTLNAGKPLPLPWFNNIGVGPVVSPTQKNIIYLSSSVLSIDGEGTQPGVYQSLDDGETWQDISGKLPRDYSPTGPYQLIPHPTQNQTLYFAYDGYLHKTVDNGKIWKVVGGGIIPREGFKLWFDPNNSQTMYAMLIRTSDPRFLYKSTDAGETWRNVSLDLQEENAYTVTYEALRFAPNSGKIIYLARAKERMYQSEDGEHWEVITDAARLERESPTGMLLSFSLPDMTFQGVYRVENIGNAVSASLSSYPRDKNYYLTNGPDNIKVQVAEHADQSTVNLKRTEAVTVQAKFEINNITTYEQPAAFFVVARYQPLDSSDAYWFMQTEDKQWLAWDGNMENLKPAKLVNQLQPTESLDIFTGMPNGVARTTSIYAGYRPSSPTYIATTISNQNSPLVLKIE